METIQEHHERVTNSLSEAQASLQHCNSQNQEAATVKSTLEAELSSLQKRAERAESRATAAETKERMMLSKANEIERQLSRRSQRLKDMADIEAQQVREGDKKRAALDSIERIEEEVLELSEKKTELEQSQDKLKKR